ncbi:MAG: hypothetical protein WD737_05265 [Gemmatimonadota bacterium]
MLEPPTLDLRLVDAADIEPDVRRLLRPGVTMKDENGVDRMLPSYFYEVPSWDAALDVQLTRHFGLWEFIDVDVREESRLRSFPRYVPCAITLLAAHLQVIRSEVGRVVRIAANGGYRSPAHRQSRVASPHSWAAAANIYRIGDDWLDTREKVEKYVQVARSALSGVWVRPYGEEPGYAFDHLHIDLGFVIVEPRGRDASRPSGGGNAGA